MSIPYDLFSRHQTVLNIQESSASNAKVCAQGGEAGINHNHEAFHTYPWHHATQARWLTDTQRTDVFCLLRRTRHHRGVLSCKQAHEKSCISIGNGLGPGYYARHVVTRTRHTCKMPPVILCCRLKYNPNNRRHMINAQENSSEARN
jgi:hypothetical protein